jgi:hypothetical protein
VVPFLQTSDLLRESQDQASQASSTFLPFSATTRSLSLSRLLQPRQHQGLLIGNDDVGALRYMQGWSKPNAFHVCITSYTLVLQDHQVSLPSSSGQQEGWPNKFTATVR